MSSSNCCFLTCIQISQEADQVVWYSHLLRDWKYLHACAGGANYGQQDTKRPKAQLPLLKNWEQKQGVRSKSRVLCMPPAHDAPKGVCKPPKPPLQADLWTGPCKWKVLVAQSCPTLCDPMDCKAPRLLYLWNSSGKYTGVSSHSLLQGIFLTQGSNLGLLHCRQILYRLSHQGSPGLAPTLTPYKEPVCPSSAREPVTCLLLPTPATEVAPIKRCLSFLSGFLLISIDEGGPRTLVGSNNRGHTDVLAYLCSTHHHVLSSPSSRVLRAVLGCPAK